MYVSGNPTTKKQLKEWIAQGRKVSVFQFNGHIVGAPKPQHPAVVYLEGPHYPQPHKWYAKGWTDAQGYLVKVQ